MVESAVFKASGARGHRENAISESQTLASVEPEGADRTATMGAPQPFEEALLQDRRFLDKVSALNPNIVFVYELAARRIVYASAAMTRLLGYSEAEAIGREGVICAVLHPDDADRAQSDICSLSAASDGQIVHSEFRIKDAWGQWRWLYTTNMVFQRDLAGSPTHILGVGVDITERKNTEIERQRSEEVRRRLFQVATEIMAETSGERLLQRVADAARDLTGAELCVCGHSVVSGKVAVKAVSPAESFAACRLLGPLDAHQGGVYLEVQLHDSFRLTEEQLRSHAAWWGLPRGHLPVRGLLGARLTTADGKVDGLIMVSGKDVGEFTEEDEDNLRHLAALSSLAAQNLEAREQAEGLTREAMWVGEALANEAQVLKVIMETMDTQLAYFDSNFNFVKVNDAYAKGVGRGPDELVGANLFSLFPNAESQAIFQQVRATGQAVHFRDKPLVSVGQPWKGVTYWDWTLTPVKKASEVVEGLVLSLRETTERMNMERSKDEFIRMVSHELRNPLTVVLGALNTATTEVVSPAETRSLLETAASGAESLAAILDNLVELARYQAERLYLAKVPVDVARMAENVAGKIGIRFDTHQFCIEIPEGLRQLEADPIRLERILFNLMENAAKFSPERSRVTVSGRQEGTHAVISVRDQGSGIPAKDLEKLFEPFKTMRSRGGKQGLAGFGLGLLTCKRMVEAHGGQVWAESQEGNGSTFSFSLPLR